MEREIRRTVEYVKPSLPKSTDRVSVIRLFRVALSEIDLPTVLLILAPSVMLVAFFASEIVSPVVAMITLSPLPILLMAKKYLFSANEPMRELELTTRYTYPQLLSAKTVILSLTSLIYLLVLSVFTSFGDGSEFIRCTLGGASAALYMSSAVFLLTAIFRSHHLWIGEASVCIWLLGGASVLLLDRAGVLSSVSEGVLGVLAAGGFIVWCFCAAFKINRERHLYVTGGLS